MKRIAKTMPAPNASNKQRKDKNHALTALILIRAKGHRKPKSHTKTEEYYINAANFDFNAIKFLLQGAALFNLCWSRHEKKQAPKACDAAYHALTLIRAKEHHKRKNPKQIEESYMNVVNFDFNAIKFALQGADLFCSHSTYTKCELGLAQCYKKKNIPNGRISGGSGWTRTTDLTLIRGAL